MKDTVFLIPTAKVLAKVVDWIDSLDMNNKDIMGDVYEYRLGKIAATGDNGQFRTLRHIIKMIVELMESKLTDRILDFACGTGGFLTSWLKVLEPKVTNTEDRGKFDGSVYGMEKNTVSIHSLHHKHAAAWD